MSEPLSGELSTQTFTCSWCPDWQHPDPAHHPDGLEHVIETDEERRYNRAAIAEAAERNRNNDSEAR